MSDEMTPEKVAAMTGDELREELIRLQARNAPTPAQARAILDGHAARLRWKADRERRS